MRQYDLCVIGSGSGNTIVDDRFAEWDVAMVDQGIPGSGAFGGTCLNVGCIPTKMFVLPADLARSPKESGRLGVDLRFEGVRWTDIRDRIFGRIDPIAEGGERYRAEADNITLYRSAAHFVDDKVLDVGGETITADTFVLAAGSRATVPPIDGLDDVTVHTSDTVMRLERLPESLIILGGGYIAAEFAHIFSAFGTRVSVVCRGPRMLRAEDEDVSRRFTELIGEQVQLHADQTPEKVEPREGGGVVMHTSAGHRLEADVLLVATGRKPNGDRLGLEATGIGLDDAGRVVVDAHQRVRPGFFALGDLSSPAQLKHVANHEARVVQHNLLHPHAMIEADHRFIPHAVFSDPQIASVGLSESEAQERGFDYAAAIQDYASVAYGWALEDEGHFVKLLADRTTQRLIGGHVLGPQASTLIQPVIQAMSFGLTVPEMARGQYWIHPALTEVIENALLALDLDAR